MRHSVVLATWTLLLASPARADAFGEVQTPRTLGMGGANRALGSSNDALLYSPGGMAMSKRYSIDGVYSYGGADHITQAQLSAVDSKTGPVAAGLAYTRIWGNPSGSNPSLTRIYGGTAFALGSLGVGLTVQNVRGHFTDAGVVKEQSLWNGNVGLQLLLGELLSVAAAYQNVLKADDPRIMPPSLGIGAAVRTGAINVAGDWRFDMRDAGPRRSAWGLGGELFLYDMFAVRGGLRRGPTDPAATGEDRTFISGGLGALSASGGLNVAAEKALRGGQEWTLIGSMQFFM
ncbi:MAG TPA: hypothetical protein VFH51_08045 [Myxococcota bacterium]|nr:hypothetical protein [Myxococcota bacterium]